MSKHDLEYWKSLNYPAVLKKAGKRFYLLIPELSIIVEGENLSETYQRLEKGKEEYFKKVIDMDATDTLEEPQVVRMRNKLALDLLIFSVKSFIVGIAVAVVIWSSLPIINDLFITQRVNKLQNGARVFIFEKLLKANNRLSSMTPEEKEQLRMNLRNAVQELKPYFDELKILWDEDSKAGARK